MGKKMTSPNSTPRIVNRRAWHDYYITARLECGLELTGTEIKSLRAGAIKIDEAHARLCRGELFLIGSNIASYPNAAPGMQHEPTRDRKLLVHRRQIDQLQAHVSQKGKTLVPLSVYFKKGWAKVEIGLAEGKRNFDKREDLRLRDAKRDIAREMGRRNRRSPDG